MPTKLNETEFSISYSLAKASSYFLIEISENIVEELFNLYGIEELDAFKMYYQITKHE